MDTERLPDGVEEIAAIPKLPARRRDAHKGDFGHVLVIAGSRGMAGAAALVGASALRSGAGLVRIASPAEVQATVASFEPSYMTWPLAGDSDGGVDFRSARAVLGDLIEPADVIAVGPGLGRSASIRSLLAWLLESSGRPLVIDADGLNALDESSLSLMERREYATILTPHPGEFARLLGVETTAVQADRTVFAVEFARNFAGSRVVVALKGFGTVITDGRRVHVNTTGNAGMATGGSGDCLTGVIAALLGQKLDPFEAALLGTYVHGLAGDIARDQSGEVGMIAGDIVDSLADAFSLLPEGE